MGIVQLIGSIVQFYIGLIVVYVLMSWFPLSGVFEEIQRVLGSIVEPYLGLFRRIIPPIGMIDISPIVAIFALQIAARVLLAVLTGSL